MIGVGKWEIGCGVRVLFGGGEATRGDLFPNKCRHSNKICHRVNAVVTRWRTSEEAGAQLCMYMVDPLKTLVSQQLIFESNRRYVVIILLGNSCFQHLHLHRMIMAH